MYTSLISTSELAVCLQDPQLLMIDCRFSLADPEQGWKNYMQSHISSAVYAHLDEDLSGQKMPGKTGRHPLPTVERASAVFSRLGIDSQVQVVAYDSAGGALAAVRLWWMLRWLGHNSVAVLDGGWQKWLAENRPVQAGVESRLARDFPAQPRPELLVSAEQVNRLRRDPAYRLFDARLPERYRGDVEPIDPVAGHIPGAINAPYSENLSPEGVFRPAEDLRSHYQALLGDIPVERVVFYCGSGVTSIHSLLAIFHAGLGEARLYAGSWSEWIADPDHPVATA